MAGGKPLRKAQYLVSQLLMLVMAVCFFFFLLELETSGLTLASHPINMCVYFSGNRLENRIEFECNAHMNSASDGRSVTSPWYEGKLY